MNSREAITNTLQMGDMVCKSYLEDLNDADLLNRPHPECNHLNWQIGHLISSDHQMVNECFADTLPALPAGFTEKYGRESTSENNAAAFCTKSELLELLDTQHAAILEKLNTLSEDDLSASGPESMQSYAPTVGAVLNLIGAHWLMHCGQWVIVRRMLGKPIVI